MNIDKIRHAFNLRENLRDIYVPDNTRMMFMDGLRCLGMFHIMLTHSLWAFLAGFHDQFQPFIQQVPWYMRWMLAGDKAVDLFFVISGFLIGQMLFREHNKTGTINLKRFFLRRFWRLTPAYYTVILLFAIFMTGPNIDKRWLWAFVFYVNNYISADHNYISYAWSLAIEEQFYALFSLLVAFLFYRIRHQQYFLWTLFVFSFAVIFALLLLHPDIVLSVDTLISKVTPKADRFWEIIYDNLHTRYGAIVLGIILAHWYVYHWEKVQSIMTIRRCWLMLLTAFGLMTLSMILPVYNSMDTPKWLLYFYHVTHRNLFAMGIMFIMMLSLLDIGVGAKVNRFLSSRIFFSVSQLTYPMYLLQLPVIVVCYLGLKYAGVISEISFANAFLVWACALLPTMFVSTLMNVFIERPFMKLRT